jgi:iron complex outermembrane receptor protein
VNKYLFRLTLIVTFSAPINPQIQGFVYQTNGYPVEYASIQHTHSGSWTFSTSTGYFYLPITLVIGDSLVVNRIGYGTTIYRISQPGTLFLNLSPKPVKLDSVKVKTNRGNFLPARDYSSQMLKADGFNSENILNAVPGLMTRNTGGMAGNRSVSLFGGPASHTKIIYDDIELTNPQNGEMDISMIPTVFFDRVRVHHRDPLVNGTGIMNGIVSIDPWQEKSNISASKGSFGFQALHLNRHFGQHTWSADFNFGLVDESGDYSVHWDGKTTRRENNWFRQRYWSGRTQKIFTDRLIFSLSIMNSNQERGVAGQIWSPSKKAKRSDQLLLTGISIRYLTRKSSFKLVGSSRITEESYSNPDFAIDSNHDVKVFNFSFHVKHSHSRRLVSKGLFQLKQEYLFSTDAGNPSNNIINFGMNINYYITPWLSINPAVMNQSNRPSINQTSGNIDLKFSGNDNFELIIGAGHGFRNPTLNDKYWNPGGNEDLESEKAKKLALEASWHSQFGLDIFVKMNQVEAMNLIQWIPGSEFWYPVNIARTRTNSLGLTAHFSNKLFPVQVQASISILDTRDILKKQSLRYAPKISGNIDLSFQKQTYSMAIQIHHTGDQIAIYDWPDNVILKNSTITTLILSSYPKFTKKQLRITLTSENLFDQRYQSVYGYPESGRRTRITMTYNF